MKKIKSYYQPFTISFFSIFFVLITDSVSFAHKVNIFAYAEGNMVYTESYFPDGKKVERGVVEVYNSRGNKLLEGRTDKGGLFNFKPPEKGNLKIVINAGMGHKNFYILPLGAQMDAPAAKSLPEDSELKEPIRVDLDKIKRIIDDSLNKRLEPVIKEMIKAQQKTSLTEVIGGIGYIFGIMGIILYFLSKKGH